MRIAMITDYYLPTLGGVQTSVKAQKEALEKLGHSVFVFCPLHGKSTDKTIIRVPTSKRFKPDNFPFAWSPRLVEAFLTKSLHEKGVDVVHIQSEMVAAVCGIKAARKLKLPLVQSMHGRLDVYTHKVLPVPSVTTRVITGFHKRHIPLSHAVSPELYAATSSARRIWRLMVSQANAAHQVIVPSYHFASKLKKQGVKKPISVLSNGIEDTVLGLMGNVSPRRYDATEPLRIMWCGRISPEKRPIEFLRSIEDISHSVQVDMYGDGLYLSRLRKYIKRHQLGDRVTLHGGVPQSEVLSAMKRSHLFVSTSYDFENQPMVFLECIATGLPLLFCDSDLAEIVPKGGFLCSNSPDEKDIRASIEFLLQNTASIESMSKTLLAHRPHITQTEHTGALVKVYRAAIEEQSEQTDVT